MKYLLFVIAFVASNVLAATPYENLNARLNKLNSFTAKFNQIVTGPDNKVINKENGTLAVKRPNQFNWTTQSEDGNVLISDGQTLWYYNPFIEQVTAMWVEEAAAQTPFVLLTQNSIESWYNYLVTQRGNTFTIRPKGSSNMGTFTIDIDPSGRIQQFAVTEKDGQKTRFLLTNLIPATPSPSLFRFTPPKGVELDDQRR